MDLLTQQSAGLDDTLIANLVRRSCVGDVTTRSAQHFGSRVALVDGDTSLTYQDLEARANSVARGLLSLGLSRGERLAILAPNCWQYVVTFFACAKAGIVLMPINTGLSAGEIAYQLSDAGAVAVIVTPEHSETIMKTLTQVTRPVRVLTLAGAFGEVGGDGSSWEQLLDHDASPVEVFVDDADIVHCLYTSGTTSSPKGVLTSHNSVLIALLASAVQLRHRRDATGSVMPVVLPLFHVTGLDALVLPVLATGGTVLLYQGFDAAVIAGAIEQYQATHLVFIPTMWEAMLTQLEREPVDTRSVEIGLYAMSPMSLERLDAMRAAFPNADILLASGMTETTPASEVQWPAHQRAKHGSWGSPSITTDVRIMDSDGTLLGPGEEGEIVYRTPQLMSQYWQNPAANREAFAHGWFHSGDIGYVDEDGVVWFTDRLKDIVKTGGENVSSLEVEQVILQHPGVLECAVVGRPHERWGEAVVACVVPVDGVVLAEAEVIAHCKQRLAGYKVPKRVDFHNSLPHTATGKVEKHKLRSV